MMSCLFTLVVLPFCEGMGTSSCLGRNSLGLGRQRVLKIVRLHAILSLVIFYKAVILKAVLFKFSIWSVLKLRVNF